MNIPYCPIRRDWCHQDCILRTVNGCEVLAALQAVVNIGADMTQISGDIMTLTSDPETVLDAAMESA